MHRGQRFVPVSLVLVAMVTVSAEAISQEKAPANPPAKVPSITLVGPDYPDYQERVGRLKLLGVPHADALAKTDSQFKRMSLVDVEAVELLPSRLEVYQTVTTDLILPVNVNYVVNKNLEGACFNPEIPYCADFDLLNTWLKEANLTVEDKELAGTIARFVVGLGLSTVHHPEDFLFFRLTQKFGVEYFHYIRDIEQLYYANQAPYRTEEKQVEYERVTNAYRDVVRPVYLEEVEQGFRLHGFTYKVLRAAGDLREWDIIVRRDGTVKVDMKTLETGIGELYWSWAP